jgi:hypothetical protein
LHTSMIGKAPAAAALPQLWSRDQLELDTLIKYSKIWLSVWDHSLGKSFCVLFLTEFPFRTTL